MPLPALSDEEMSAPEAPVPLSHEEMDDPAHRSYSMPEAAAGALANGMLWGGAPAAGGMIKAATSYVTDPNDKREFWERYVAHRDRIKGGVKKAHQDYPRMSTALEMTGAALPGALVGGPLGGLAGSVIGGGAIGLNEGDADVVGKGEWGQAAKEGAVGAATGGLAHGALSMAGKALKEPLQDAAAWVGNKVVAPGAAEAGSVLFNLPRQVTRRYVDAKRQGRDLLQGESEHHVARELYDEAMPQLRQDVTEGSKASRNLLEMENTQIPTEDLAKIYGRKWAELHSGTMGVQSDLERAKTIAELLRLQNTWKAAGRGSEGTPVNSKVLGPNGQPYQTMEGAVPPMRSVPGGRVKDEVQMLQGQAKYDLKPNTFAELDENTAKSLAHDVGERLKDESPAYRQMMTQQADDTALLAKMGKIVPSDKTGLNVYRRAAMDEHGAGQLPMDTLKAFDDRMGTNYVDRAADAGAKRIMENPRTNGSRGVNLYKTLADATPLPEFIKKPVGALLGGYVDKGGTPLVRGAMSMAADLSNMLAQVGPSVWRERLAPVMKAAANGDHGAALALYILKKKHPEAFGGGEK